MAGENAIPPDIAPGAIRAALRSRLIGQSLEVYQEIASTNDRAMAAGRAGAPEGLAVLADRQTAGRGRRGRAWASPSGRGLYTSILLRPRVDPTSVPLITLAAGLAVADGIREVSSLSPQLKWPNDVWLNGRKVAGILTELAMAGPSVSHVVVGIGINVNQRREDFPEELREATSVSLESGRSIVRAALAAVLYNGLDRWYDLFCKGRTESILEEGRRRSATLGKPVRVLGGTEEWQGLAMDLDADGALLVQDEAGTRRRVMAGDVSIRETSAA